MPKKTLTVRLSNNDYNITKLQCRAGHYEIPHLQQYLPVETQPCAKKVSTFSPACALRKLPTLSLTPLRLNVALNRISHTHLLNLP